MIRKIGFKKFLSTLIFFAMATREVTNTVGCLWAFRVSQFYAKVPIVFYRAFLGFKGES